MAKSMTKWLCENKVSFEYLCSVTQECTDDCVNSVLENLMRDFPEHYLKIGITHNPCGRFTGNYSDISILQDLGFKIRHSIVDATLLNERAHQEDFEKMFVICFCNNEADIRRKEIDGISIGKEIDTNTKTMSEPRILNLTAGGNGNLKKDQPYYFLYACITKIRPLLEHLE